MASPSPMEPSFETAPSFKARRNSSWRIWNVDRRSEEQQAIRHKIDLCLDRAKLAGPQARVVPLTGDASTRQYFRVMRPDNPSVVLAVYDAPFAFAELPFVNVSRLMTNIPL